MVWKTWLILFVQLAGLIGLSAAATLQNTALKTCKLSPIGNGTDDVPQILKAVARCGRGGKIVLGKAGDVFTIKQRMNWTLNDALVEWRAELSFVPDIDYWFNKTNTYTLFLQSQATCFIVGGSNIEIDAFGTGGINGNGQVWWSHFNATGLQDGDGRPISLTISRAKNMIIRNFRIESPPFWSSIMEYSKNVTIDGMFVNATNVDPIGFGRNIVPNTDGINTWNSDDIKLLNWDITCGDDCLAIKGNTTNLFASNYTCRGGNGPAFGSLGQYQGMPDIVENIHLRDFHMFNISRDVQPNMANGVYFKTWLGVKIGDPPTGGGGAGGRVNNVHIENFRMEGVGYPVLLTQTQAQRGAPNAGQYANTSLLKFSNITFTNLTGFTSTRNDPVLVRIQCSSAAPCENIRFEEFEVTRPTGSQAGATYRCSGLANNVTGLAGPCVP